MFCNGSIHMTNTSEDSDSILIFPFLSDKEKIPKRIPERKKEKQESKKERKASKEEKQVKERKEIYILRM